MGIISKPSLKQWRELAPTWFYAFIPFKFGGGLNSTERTSNPDQQAQGMMCDCSSNLYLLKERNRAKLPAWLAQKSRFGVMAEWLVPFPDHCRWASHRCSWRRSSCRRSPTGLVVLNTGEAMPLSTVACLVRE